MASIYDNRFCIPSDFEILETSLPLYQYGLGSRLTYELIFADYSCVIKATDPDATYTISNISLEFDTIINASLASQIRTEYMKSRILSWRAEEGLKSHQINHADISITGCLFLWNPRIWKNTIKSTFSPRFDSFFILYDIQDNSVSQKSEKNCLVCESK